jgi:hypothetical protein
VTSIDWMTYPILDITETPESIEVALINHPELPPTGAGEPSIRPVAAAIANAIFDAGCASAACRSRPTGSSSRCRDGGEQSQARG